MAKQGHFLGNEGILTGLHNFKMSFKQFWVMTSVKDRHLVGVQG